MQILFFSVSFNTEQYKVYMRMRPNCEQFLATMSQLFEIVVFTASQKCYADKLLNILDTNGKYIHHRLFRDDCVQVQENFVKDLRILGRDLSKVIIVDNSPPAFAYQIDNGIPIISWFDDDNDKELLNMMTILNSLRTQPDVRIHIRKYFELRKLLKHCV